MKVACQLCDERLSRDVFELFTDKFADDDILEEIYKLAPNFQDITEFCRFADFTSDCDRFFSPVITDEGLCYTFNGMNINETFTNQ